MTVDALTTVARLAGYLEITPPTANSPQDIALQAVIAAVTAFIEDYTNITFRKVSYVEEYSTERGQTLNLLHFPVVETEQFLLERRNSQLTEDHWELIDGLYYVVDVKAGIVRCMDGVYFFRSRNGYRVSYTAGYDFDNVTKFLADTAAGDVELACWLIAKDLWLSKKVASNLYQEKIGDYSVTFQRPVKGATGFGFENPQAMMILDKYANQPSFGVLTPLQSV